LRFFFSHTLFSFSCGAAYFDARQQYIRDFDTDSYYCFLEINDVISCNNKKEIFTMFNRLYIIGFSDIFFYDLK